jgi:hypothetical protein
VDAAAGSEQLISGFALESGADYRLSVHSSALTPCSEGCGTLELRVGGESSVVSNVAGQPSTLATRLFRAGASGAAQIALRTLTSRRALGGVVLLREGQVNAFDSPEDRLEAALYPLELGAAAQPLPMRFAGDGSAGFLALLKRNERMALLRQALAPGQRWTIRMSADSYEGLSCGLLDMRAAPASRVPCAALMKLDDSAGTQGRLGFYVELAAASTRERTSIRYLAIASGTARDTDEDGVPEVLDNCPGDWNAAQLECSEQKPEPPPPPAQDASLSDAGLSEAGVTDAGVTDAGLTDVSVADVATGDATTEPSDAQAPVMEAAAQPQLQPMPQSQPAPPSEDQPQPQGSPQVQPDPEPQSEPELAPEPETESSLDPAQEGEPQAPRGRKVVSSCAAHPGGASETQVYLGLLASLVLLLRTRTRRARHDR